VSRFVSPFRGATLGLVVRALDVMQSLGDAGAAFSPEERGQLLTLGLWHPGGWIEPDAYRRVGRTLYRALAADPRGAQALGTVRDYAAAQGCPVGLSLRLPPDAVELAALPWELLWDEGRVPLLLSRGRVSSCTRYLDLPQAVPPLPAEQVPLRVLALVPHAGVPAGVRQEERRARLAAWQSLVDAGYVEVREVSPVSREALVDALQGGPAPDVIHYYGHGRYENGTGELLLDSPDGGEAWTDASSLAAVLGGVRMVVLFACQGAMVGARNDLLTGLAPALSAAGVPIVLGMQLTVRVSAATRASSVMYRALVAGWSVQRAVSLVRQALYVEESDRASWYVPVLYVRSTTSDPVYLLAAPTAEPRHAAATQPGAAVPARASEPAVRQYVIARQHSRISDVAAHSSGGASSVVGAHDHSAVERVRARAAGGGQQQVRAEGESQIADVNLDAT
jgi:hypothetical protein